MARTSGDLTMPIKPLNIFTYYDRQRFLQFSPQDCANWYLTQAPTGKRQMAMYPAMGRKHLSVNNVNLLQFNGFPRAIFKSINFMYVIVGRNVYQVSKTWNSILLSNSDFTQTATPVWFDFLPLIQGATADTQTQAVFCMLTDGINCYIINESVSPPTMTTITDTNVPPRPTYVAAFGNRFVVSAGNSSEFRLTQVNCADTDTGTFNAATLFTVPSGVGGQAVFAQESGVIQQMKTLHNQLYIFTDFTTGIWTNVPSTIQTTTATTQFPWKKNTSYEWDYGLADPYSVDVDFGRMVWLAQNRNGLVTFMSSDGQMPKPISTQAINVLLQQSATNSPAAPFLIETASGFLYQYEDSIFYRISAGFEETNGQLLINESAASLEYNFDTGTWARRIELDGDRNLIHDHVFFNNYHLVSVLGQDTLYIMAGNVYVNELRNPDQSNGQAIDAYLSYPMRYELVTPIYSEEDYSEFVTKWVQIDFVWGEQTFINSDAPFINTTFIVKEEPTDLDTVYMVAEDGQTYIIQDGTNQPSLDDTTYNKLFKPSIELFVSDDGGVSFYTVDTLEFSQLGVYSWRMRWYQCGLSRNRCYKLVCVSPSPIVILGGIHLVERSSGGQS